MTVLDTIFAHKRQEVELRKAIRPLVEVRTEAEDVDQTADFLAALRKRRAAQDLPALIAEIKKASPSKGLLSPDFDPLQLAQVYADNGAAAISVLTDERFFQGSLKYLRQVHASFPCMPLLCKDFIYDPYQVYEARAAGASAVLLIVAALEAGLLLDLHTLALEMDLTPLVEVHSLQELEVALACHPFLIGINNRDLRDFSVRLETTLVLRPCIPYGIGVVAESGIHSAADILRLGEAGIDAVLVGEALVTAGDVGVKVRQLAGVL